MLVVHVCGANWNSLKRPIPDCLDYVRVQCISVLNMTGPEFIESGASILIPGEPDTTLGITD
jgi:hypothetical protein